MPIRSADLFALAQRLRASDREVERRASTSRLYYGVLQYIIECLEEHLSEFSRRLPPPQRTHTFSLLLSELPQSGIAGYRYVSNQLRELKNLRERADYDVDLGDWPPSNVEAAEAHASEIFGVLRDLHPDGGFK